MQDQVISVSEFVALVNQTMEFAYPVVTVEGEVSEFRVSKNRWVYFNLQDDNSSVRMFGTVFQLKQPIEDGMKVVVKGSPRLHNKYGFSLNISSISPSGEGSIKKAFELLKKKLTQEGLFAPERKRPLPDMPQRIGLITSGQAAAYTDFLKIIDQRWSGLDILHADVQVQGDAAPAQLVKAIDYFSQMPDPVDLIVITRGGGGAEDLMAFSTEEVARAVAGSRIPTIVGVGHEIDTSLADLAADVRATTPTNAAQLAVPDRVDLSRQIDGMIEAIGGALTGDLGNKLQRLEMALDDGISDNIESIRHRLEQHDQKLQLVNPANVLNRGYSMVTTSAGKVVKTGAAVKKGDELMIRFSKGSAKTEVIDAKSK